MTQAASEAGRLNVAPFGTWTSPITPELLTQGSISFGEIAVVASADTTSQHQQPRLVYVENRPAEKGRAALMAVPIADNRIPSEDASFDLTRGDLNARSAVHEYGGGALAAGQAGTGSVIFSSYEAGNHAVYRASAFDSAAAPERITPQQPALRFADFCPSPRNPDLILAVQEDHSVDEPSQVVNTLVLIDAKGKSVKVVAEGKDFYTSPRWSPDGRFVAWVCWDHPEMPFWASELWVAAFDPEQRSLGPHSAVAGQKGRAVISHPLWLRDGADNVLVYTDDSENGFSLPTRVNVSSGADHTVQVSQHSPLLRHALEADLIKPPWTLNSSTLVDLGSGVLACALTRGSTDTLAIIRMASRELIEVDTPYRSFAQLRRVSETVLVANVASPQEPAAIVLIDLSDVLARRDRCLTARHLSVVKSSSDLLSSGRIAKECLSQPEDITFPTILPPEGEPALAHAILYRPRNPHFCGPRGASPPCIFKIHGGPTSSAAGGELNWETNFWTTRGYSVCFVNYGGSTGYGRSYTMRLNDKWGLVDVQDCVAAAKFLSQTGSSADSTDASVRREDLTNMTTTAQEQWKNMQEVYDPTNGFVRVTLNRGKGLWNWADAIVVPLVALGSIALGKMAIKASATAGASGLLAAHPTFATAGLTLSALAGYLGVFKTAVSSESVMASGVLGLQLETRRSLYLPWQRKSGVIVSTKRTHIPRDRILDVVLNSGVQGWTIRDYLAVGIRSVPGEKAIAGRPAAAGQTAVTRRLVTLFPDLAPRLPVVQRIYRAIYPALFPQSSNPLTNAKAPVPELRRDSSNVEHSGRADVPLADPNKIIISGGSAGGYSVLACLTNHPDVFSAATSKYGIADLNLLAAESHKFESRYPLRLLSGTPEEVPEVYRDRSPIWKADRIKTPLLVAQGSEDKVVPPNQSEMIVKAIQNQEGGEARVKYLLFEGEGHGFRQKDNVIKMLNEEEAWYRKTLKLDQ
ncbi:unnamed protein product [Parajaminaea phylloscopi]